MVKLIIQHIADNLQILVNIVVSTGIIGGAIIWLYRKVLAPVHHRISIIGDIIERELLPNGGSALVDKIKRIEGKVDDVIGLQASADIKINQHIFDSSIHHHQVENTESST